MRYAAVIFLSALIVLSGCASKRRAAAAAHGASPDIACGEALVKRTDFDPIRTKVFLAGAQGQPAEMLSNSGTPTNAEKPVIATWIDARQDCFRQGQAWREERRMSPEFSAIAKDTNAAFLALTADLQAGKLTYGEYARARRDLAAKAQVETERLQRYLGAGGTGREAK
jgi:hypothetical protein